MAVNYFEELRKKILEKEDSQTREDDLALIDALENKHPEILKNSVYAQILNNVQLMDTLITAYQKMHGSFAVYSYCGPVVQNNYEIAGQVVLSQPELITKTDLINDPNFIVLYLERVPQLREWIRGYDVEKDDKVLAEIERIE